MGERKVADVETWPHLRVTLHVFPWAWTWPWHWRRMFWRDVGMTSSFSVNVLFVEVWWSADCPMFTEEARRG